MVFIWRLATRLVDSFGHIFAGGDGTPVDGVDESALNELGPGNPETPIVV